MTGQCRIDADDSTEPVALRLGVVVLVVGTRVCHRQLVVGIVERLPSRRNDGRSPTQFGRLDELWRNRVDVVIAAWHRVHVNRAI